MRFSFGALIAAPLLMLASTISLPAFAGEWVVVYRNVDYTGSQGINGSGPEHNREEVWSYETGSIVSAQLRTVPAPAGTGKAVAKMKFKVYAVWTDPMMQEFPLDEYPEMAQYFQPPSRVFVKEVVSGSASYSPFVAMLPNWTPIGILTSGSVSVDLPFGVPEPNGGPAQQRIPDSARLKVIDNSSHSFEVLIGEYTLTSTASVTIPPQEYAWSDQFYGSVHVQNVYGAVAVEKGVVLSSGIEASYCKGTGPSDTFISELNKRAEDGSITVDSALSGTLNNLSGSAHIKANLTGIEFAAGVFPDYSWESSGVIPGTFTPDSNSLSGYPDPFRRRFDVEGISKDSLPDESKIKFKVKDYDTNEDLKAEYNIRWHLPWENGSHVGEDEPAPNQTISYGWTAQSAQQSNLLGATVSMHRKNPEITWGDFYSQFGGGLLGSLGGPAGSAAGEIFGKRLPGGAGENSTIPLTVALATELLLITADYAISQNAAPDIPDVSKSAGKAELREAIQIQRKLNRRETAGIDAPYLERIDPDIAEAIDTEEKFDIFYRGKAGKIRFVPSQHQYCWKMSFKGDGYNNNGYMGDVTQTIVEPRTIFDIYQFTVGD